MVKSNKSNICKDGHIRIILGLLAVISIIISLIYWFSREKIWEIAILHMLPFIILLLDVFLYVSLHKKMTTDSLVVKYLWLPFVFTIFVYVVSASSVVFHATDKPILLFLVLSCFLAITVFILYSIRKFILKRKLVVVQLWCLGLKYLSFIFFELVLYIFIFFTNFTYQ